MRYKRGTPHYTELTYEKAIISNKSADVNATGNVVLKRDGKIWKAEKMDYNFRTKQGKYVTKSGNSGRIK